MNFCDLSCDNDKVAESQSCVDMKTLGKIFVIKMELCAWQRAPLTAAFDFGCETVSNESIGVWNPCPS